MLRNARAARPVKFSTLADLRTGVAAQLPKVLAAGGCEATNGLLVSKSRTTPSRSCRRRR